MSDALLRSHRDAWTVALGPAPAEAKSKNGAATVAETVAATVAEAVTETVVLVPPGAPLADGFAACRVAVDAGRPARLIARGATLAEKRPDWARDPRARLSLSELDGYTPRGKGALMTALEPGLRAWLDELLGGVVPGAPASEIFFAVAMVRFFAEVSEAWLTVRAVEELHARDRVGCTVPRSALGRLLAARRASSANAMDGATAATATAVSAPWNERAIWGALAATPAALAGAARRLWTFAREARSRRRLRTLRDGANRDAHDGANRDAHDGANRDAHDGANHGAHDGARTDEKSPRIWMGIIGNWPRMTRPVTDMLPPLLRAARESAGALLQASLTPGAQPAIAARYDPAPIFPTLDLPGLDGVTAAVDQGVSAENLRELLPTLFAAIGCTVRAALRSRRARLILDDGEARVVLAPPPGALARLLSVDVLRAREAWDAARRLTTRRDFSRALVVWPHCNGAADATTDFALRRAGATTVELMHGLSEVGYALRTGSTSTTMKILWTVPEAEDMTPFRPAQRCRGGYFPRPRPAPVPRAPLTGGEPVTILIASSYLVSAYGDDPTVFEPYQAPLLAGAVEAARALGRPAQLRWRPHPGDDAGRVERLRRAWPSLETSTGTLDDDLRWARVLVSSMSSVVFEALFYDLPVFVHDIPRWDDLSMRVLDPRRLFGREHQLAELLAPCVAQGLSLAPEQALKRKLFGGPEPRSLSEILWPEAAPRSARDQAI